LPSVEISGSCSQSTVTIEAFTIYGYHRELKMYFMDQYIIFFLQSHCLRK
jgi:hypothetical protein